MSSDLGAVDDYVAFHILKEPRERSRRASCKALQCFL